MGVAEPVDAAAPEQLNSRGSNVLCEMPGRGLHISGALAQSANAKWKCVNVRRVLSFLEHSIERGTQRVVFALNGERTQARVGDSVRSFLRTVWLNGALPGRMESQAYFVRCDRTTLTRNDIDLGRLICLVGPAPARPAERIVSRIGQRTADWAP